MNQNDYEQFLKLLEKTCVYYSKAPNDGFIEVYWNLLKDRSLQEVAEAIKSHMRDPEQGQFFPLVAHLTKHFNANDGRRTADEWWPDLPRSEAESIFWTAEAANAHAICAPLLESGDEIAARMSFKAAYDAAARKAREAHLPVQWCWSPGHDINGQEMALRKAIDRGFLQIEKARRLLPHVDFENDTHRLPCHKDVELALRECLKQLIVRDKDAEA